MENQDSTNSFQVNLDQFNGPLDLLLDLAKSQKVNLENISITLLADQFLEYINKVIDIFSKLTFCDFAKSKSKSKGPLN